MLCFPYPVSVAVNDEKFIHLADGVSGSTYPELADTIYRYTGDGNWEMAFLFNSNGAHPEYDNKWIDRYTNTISNWIINPGESFWFHRQSGAGPFTWSVEKPY